MVVRHAIRRGTQSETHNGRKADTMTGRTKRRALGWFGGMAEALPAALVATAAAVAPATLIAQDCRFTETIELTESAVSTLRVDAGSGTLSITGSEGTSEFRLAAKLCASDEGRLEGLGVTLRGDRLDTTYPSNRGGVFSWGRNQYARIDLELEVPVETNLRVDDSSGSIRIAGTGDVTLEDGSGSIVIRDSGSLTVEDGSGSITITGVNGDLRLDDSSGSLKIEGVNGNVVIDDGSGSLTIRDVSGDVTVSDGSGSITVEAVGGSVRMNGTGGGSVTVRNVDGDLVVRDGRRERIRYSDIRGKLDLPPARRGGR